MESRTYRLLEFPRLLTELSRLALSEGGRQRCLHIEPLDDSRSLAEARSLLAEGLQQPETIQEALTAFPDMEGVLGQLDRDVPVDEDGLWGVSQALSCAESARSALARMDGELFPRLAHLADELPRPQKTRQGLARCLDHNGELKDESSPELLEMRQELRKIHAQCTKKVGDYLERKNVGEILQDEYLTISSDRYVLALKTNFKGRLSGIIHDYSQSGETCYFEPMFLVEINNRLQELKQQEREAKRRVLQYLTSLLRQEEDLLRRVSAWLIHIDLLRAKVLLAKTFEGVTLKMEPDCPVRLMQVRHPLLLLDGEQVQPVDIELKPGQKGLIISGGNSGGKTVCLKTLGLAALMGLCGLPVPAAEDSTLPYWSNIAVFLGDEQSLQEHLSTFTAQIEHLHRAWDGLDAGSLVLLDEFGAGTDPSQGAALAQAVMDSLLEKDVWIAAATHFPALKAYGLGHEQVRASSVLFDPETKLPLYTLAYDQVGASQALDVAKEYGLPATVLERAEQYLLLDGQDASGLLGRLNELAVQREQEIRELREEKERLQREREQLRAKLQQELGQVMEEVRQRSREILKEWQQGRRSRKQAQQELKTQKDRLAREMEAGRDGTDEPAVAFASLEPGSSVRYLPWSKSGQVESKDERKQKVKLNLGGVSIWADPEELSWSPSGRRELRSGSFSKVSPEGAGVTLDLRGQRIEEARMELFRFLDQAVYRGREELEIIHGRGSGALRHMVHEELRRFPRVGSFFLAPEDQGGDGVTLVSLS